MSKIMILALVALVNCVFVHANVGMHPMVPGPELLTEIPDSTIIPAKNPNPKNTFIPKPSADGKEIRDREALSYGFGYGNMPYYGGYPSFNPFPYNTFPYGFNPYYSYNPYSSFQQAPLPYVRPYNKLPYDEFQTPLSAKS